MKKMFLAMILMITALPILAQSENYRPYVGVNVSVTNTEDFKEDAFASIDIGVRQSNTAFGVTVGRQNLDNIGQTETIENYFYEGKLSLFHDFGLLEGYLVGGIGSGFSDNDIFIEYGAGINKPLGNNFAVNLQLTNFDTVNYLSGGVKVLFN